MEVHPAGELKSEGGRRKSLSAEQGVPARNRNLLPATGSPKRRDLDGYSYREIAREAGVALKTVESRLYRAKKQLRMLLESGETETGPR